MIKLAYKLLVSAALVAGAASFSGPASAGDDPVAAATKDIEQTFGFVPTFMKQMPKAGYAGAWQQLKELEFSDGTALPAKVKAPIGLAVVAQIPCQYCIWADAAGARQAGATDEEIGEAVAIGATERYWSTMLNGLQVDLATFKKELGPVFAVEGSPK
jgi:AhpD family alkylhydroperoxidase